MELASEPKAGLQPAVAGTVALPELLPIEPTIATAPAPPAQMRRGTLPRGVRPRLRAKYLAGLPGDGVAVPPEKLNDNYCDCPAAAAAGQPTDEPGTSACASITLTVDQVGLEGGGFYCGWATEGDEAAAYRKGLDQEVFASRVNDGICDCVSLH